MSTQDKKEQAINPQPERDEPSAAPRPEEDESRIGGQAAGQSGGGTSDDERTGEGTGAKAGEYS